jgi:hypothetical protein
MGRQGATRNIQGNVLFDTRAEATFIDEAAAEQRGLQSLSKKEAFSHATQTVVGRTRQTRRCCRWLFSV